MEDCEKWWERCVWSSHRKGDDPRKGTFYTKDGVQLILLFILQIIISNHQWIRNCKIKTCKLMFYRVSRFPSFDIKRVCDIVCNSHGTSTGESWTSKIWQMSKSDVCGAWQTDFRKTGYPHSSPSFIICQLTGVVVGSGLFYTLKL